MFVTRLLVKYLRKALARPLYRKFAAFELACQQPQAVQQELLQQILFRNRDTAFGHDHHFASIKTVSDFRQHVPIHEYEQLHPYIQRVMNGETSALLAEPALMFALTSGTTANRKHIPITATYIKDYQHSWNLWGLQAIREHRQIFLKPIVQLVGDADEYRTEADIPCGNLSGFTAQCQRKIMRWMYAVPAATGKIKDPTARMYVAVRGGLKKPLGMLMSANPSTLVNLARMMNDRKEDLIRDIADGTLNARLDIPNSIRDKMLRRWKPNPKRAKQLESYVSQAGVLYPKDAWPAEKLLIGCWTGGTVRAYLRQLEQYYGDAPVRDLGLLASEGRMSIPIEDGKSGGILDVTTHFYEFIPESEINSSQPIILQPHELKMGENYFILPTTKSGLYRYHICDLVRVTDFFHQTPIIEFVGKGSRFSNITGEKLSEHQVTASVDHLVTQLPQSVRAYAVAPIWDAQQPYYGFYIEEQDARDPELLRKFIIALDTELQRRNIEYQAKRESLRLGPLQAVVINNGAWHDWDLHRVRKTGGSVEQYKHPCLIGDLEFANQMKAVEILQNKSAA
ncbi:MAG: GH3 auxin-responsive promoter family protein [Zavarzinella sp.]